MTALLDHGIGAMDLAKEARQEFQFSQYSEVA